MPFRPLTENTKDTLFSAPALKQSESSTGNIQPQQPPTDRHGGSFGLLDLLGGLGSLVDAVSAAPTRAGLSAGLKENKKGGSASENLKAGLSAALEQFMSFDASKAPTGGEIARKDLNIPTSTIGTKPRTLPNKADLAGFGIDVLADVGNVLPVRMAPKVVGKGIQAATGQAPDLIKNLPIKSADFITGSTIPSRTLKAVKAGAGESIDTIKRTFTSDPAPDFLRFEDIAKRNNISIEDLPASVKFGKESLKSRAERFRTQGPEGEQLFQNFEKKSAEINQAIRNDVRRVGGGEPLKDFEAGALLRTKFDETVNKMFDDISVSYDNAVPNGSYIEDDAFIKLDGTLRSMKKSALRDAKKGASNEVVSQGEQLVRNIDNIQKGKGTYKETLQSMRDIGKAAFRSQNPATVSPDVKEMQKLYFSLRDALTETVAFHNPEIAEQLVSNNVLITELLGDKSVLAEIVQNRKLSDEQVFNNLIMNGNSKKIEALKTFFGGPDMQKLKGAFLDGVVRDNEITGSIGARSTANLLGKKENIASFLFHAGEVDNFKDLLALSDRLGSPILSSSDTGGSLQFLKTAPLRGLESGIEAFAAPVARKPEATILPAIQTPKAFLQGKGSKAKALQTFSTQREDSRREAIERAVVVP